MILAALFLATSSPQAPSLQSDFDSLVAAERNFSKLAEAKGIKESFLANIADDGVIFRPGPIPGKEWLSAHPNPPALLAWHPVHAEISLSRDLGWTTGPYEITPEGQPKGYGQFSTIWKRQPDGQWKFILDLGVNTPGPAPEGEPKLRTPEAVAEKVDATAFRESVLAADRDLATRAAQGLAAAYATVATDKTYLLRDGHPPFVGKKAVQDALAQDPGGLTWEPKDGGVSGAGDLAYTYGTVSRKDPEESGSYMRVWERHPGGVWKLALDVVKLAAAKKVITPVKPPGSN
jgi:ketosteroid isomerase-like protein